MKKLIAVANWKANKTIEETKDWIGIYKDQAKEMDNVEVVVCPPFAHLDSAKELLKGSNIKLGSQTVSSKRLGAFTGEVPAELLVGTVSYSIVGHSERRRYFNENSTDIAQKLENLISVGIKPVLCISDLAQLDEYLSISEIFRNKSAEIIFVYEPPNAISGGGDYRPESTKSVLHNVTSIREKLDEEVVVLYGGSVNKDVLTGYLESSKIDGVLVGKASLDPYEFAQISKILASSVI